MLNNYDLSLIKGITARKLERLNLMGLFTVGDLLMYFPYRYENYQLIDLNLAQHNEKVTVEGELSGEPYLRYLGQKRNMLTAQIQIDNRLVSLVWFNRGFLKKQLIPGRNILVTGKWDKYRRQITVAESSFPDTATLIKKGKIMPIYTVPAGFYLIDLQKIMQQALTQFSEEIKEYLPARIVESYKLFGLKEAIKAIHFPADEEQHLQAKRRLIYDELIQYQLRLQIHKKRTREEYTGQEKPILSEKITGLVRSLPYSLTNDQQEVIDEIFADLSSGIAMNRLLQGDVGSGKTIVAIITLYTNYLAGFQGAFMVPTEILAIQHKESLKEVLEPLGVRVKLLTGSLSIQEQEKVLAETRNGDVDVIIGTHSLFQERVQYYKLGLIIVDEQHRFGVVQREELRKKGEAGQPDVLYMSATPIPRTLAITVYGEMDISTIRNYPKGRKEINTSLISRGQFAKALDFMELQLAKGKQAYIISPLIEESEKLDLQNAVELHQLISKKLPEYKIGIMHSRLPTQEKEEIIADFKKNRVQALVSTTVIEVGVNIKNVTLIIIYDADRFGLAQLHQLRGRVGRGDDQSYCILVADPTTEAAKERLKSMLETNDGFEIAKRDLEIRGAGDLLGVRQSGLPDFKLADVIRDYRTLETAARDAKEWVSDERLWKDSEYSRLLTYIEQLDDKFMKS